MQETLPYSIAPLVALMGLVAYVAISELWLWRGSRHETFHGWAMGLTMATLVFLIGRFVQRLAVDPGPAILGLKLQYASGVCIATIAVGFTKASNDRAPSRNWIAFGSVVTVAVALFVMLGTAVVGTRIEPRVDVFGRSELMPQPGAVLAMALVMLVIVLHVALAALEMRTSRGVGAQRRRALGPIAWICAIASINDVCFSLGVLHTLPLLEYALASVAVMANFLMDRRVDDQFRNLNRAVADRTLALEREQAKLEEALSEVQRAEVRFRELAHATLEGIVVFENGVVLDANEALARLVGTSSADLRGKKLLSLFDETSYATLAPLLAQDARHPVEADLVTHSGTLVTVEVVGSRAQRGEHEVGVLAIRDIGERKRLQGRLVLADRLASVGRLAAGAAHEINNPLTYVIGNLEAALEDLAHGALSDEKRQEHRGLLKEALDGCQRVAHIMRDLRELARSEDSKLEAVDVREVLRRALKMSQNELRHRAKVVEAFDDVPHVHGDEKRLGQVFLNLLSNAAQAIPEEDSSGAHRISIAITADRIAGRVVVEIEDTGRGIAQDVLPQVFDPFFTTKTQGKGMGLGLSISHSIVTSFGGDITIKSRPPRGTTVRVVLPFASQELVAEKSGPHAAAPPARVGKVLVVDDDLAVARTIARALRKHEVQMAASGEDALSQIETRVFDVVVCDLMMPGMTGMELFDAVSKSKPDLAKRMIFVTGGAFTERAREFLERAPNPKLDKPLDVKRLRALVDELIGASYIS